MSLAVGRGKMRAETFSLKIRSRLSPLAIDRQSSRSHVPQELTVSHQYYIESKSELYHYQISSVSEIPLLRLQGIRKFSLGRVVNLFFPKHWNISPGSSGLFHSPETAG